MYPNVGAKRCVKPWRTLNGDNLDGSNNSLCSGLVGAVVAAIVTATRTAAHDNVQTAKAMQDGMKLLLCDKARYLTDCAIQDGEITVRQRAVICEMVDVAHALGANGEMTACANAVKALPTIRE